MSVKGSNKGKDACRIISGRDDGILKNESHLTLQAITWKGVFSEMSVRFVYTGIRVKDIDESVKFYTKGLDMKVVGRARVEMTRGEWAQLKSRTSAQLLELNWYGRDSPFYSKYRGGNELDHLCFAVDSMETALKKLEALGGKKIGGPYLTDG